MTAGLLSIQTCGFWSTALCKPLLRSGGSCGLTPGLRQPYGFSCGQRAGASIRQFQHFEKLQGSSSRQPVSVPTVCGRQGWWCFTLTRLFLIFKLRAVAERNPYRRNPKMEQQLYIATPRQLCSLLRCAEVAVCPRPLRGWGTARLCLADVSLPVRAMVPARGPPAGASRPHPSA